MVSRYRVIEEGDQPDKGYWGGHCNVKSCQAPNAYWYNTATDSYYCRRCAMDINRANFSSNGFKDLCVYDPEGEHNTDDIRPESSLAEIPLSKAESKRERKKRLVEEHNKKYVKGLKKNG